MQRKIIWHRWKDPLAHLVHGPDRENSDEDDELEEVLAQAARDSFLDEDEPAYEPDRPRRGQLGPGIIGPMGIIPLHEDNLPGKLFNFWMGHANFDLTRPLVDAIAAVPGVEGLDVFTRYRFRVAIGKAFDPASVRQAIDLAVQDRPASPGLGEGPLAAVKSMLQKQFPHWAVYIMPNGRFEVAGGSTIDEVKSKGQRFQEEAREVVVSWN